MEVQAITYRDFIRDVKQLNSLDEARKSSQHSKVRLFGKAGDTAGLSCALKYVQFSENPESEVVMDANGQCVSLKMGKGDTQNNIGRVNFCVYKRTDSHPLFYLNNKPLANYYHCLTDGLGILYSMTCQNYYNSILMHQFPPYGKNESHCRFVYEMLRLALPKTPVVFIDYETRYSDVLTGSYLGLNKNRHRAIPGPGLAEMYSRIRSNCREKVSGPKKIFLTRMRRTDARNIPVVNNLSNRELVNEGELLTLMQGYGFQPVFAEDYELEAQISLFSQATHVTGPWGAGFINSVFCPPGAMIMPFGSPNFYLDPGKKKNVYMGPLFADKWVCPLNKMGDYLFGPTKATNVPWRIDIAKAKKAVEKVLVGK